MQTRLLIDDLFRLVHVLKQRMLHDLSNQGVSLAPMQMQGLKWISMHEWATANDMAKFFNRDKAQVTRLIQNLIADDFVVKQPNPSDGRSQLLALTDSGKAVIDLLREQELAVMQELYGVLSEEDMQALSKLTKTLFEAVKPQCKA